MESDTNFPPIPGDLPIKPQTNEEVIDVLRSQVRSLRREVEELEDELAFSDHRQSLKKSISELVKSISLILLRREWCGYVNPLCDALHTNDFKEITKLLEAIQDEVR